jgi:hypothetical protein
VYRTLKLYDIGLAVAFWQQFLTRKNLMNSFDKKDSKIGVFEQSTEEATKQYQAN